MHTVGITGSFAVGKTIIINYISSLGFATFVSDNFVNDLYRDKEIQQKILKIIPQLNHFDKKEIAKLVYSDNNILNKVQNFIHPYVIEGIKSFKLSNSCEKLIFIEIPLLFEINLSYLFDFIVTVFCSEKTRIFRAQTRDNFDLKSYDKIAQLQFAQDEKIKRSDFVVNSDVKMLELQNQIIQLLEDLQCNYEK